jgi:hypothetical protein
MILGVCVCLQISAGVIGFSEENCAFGGKITVSLLLFCEKQDGGTQLIVYTYIKKDIS